MKKIINKRKEQSLKTRQKILDIASKLVAKKGLDNLNVEDITEACGVAKGTFYIYFKHKEDIAFELCRPSFEQIKLNFLNDKYSNILQKLTQYFNSFMYEVQRYGINICREWIKGVIDPKTAPTNMDSKKWQYDINMLQDILKTAIENKELKKDTPIDLISNVIISQLYGMMTCWCMSDADFEPSKWTKKFCDIQLEILLKKYIVKVKEKKMKKNYSFG